MCFILYYLNVTVRTSAACLSLSWAVYLVFSLLLISSARGNTCFSFCKIDTNCFVITEKFTKRPAAVKYSMQLVMFHLYDCLIKQNNLNQYKNWNYWNFALRLLADVDAWSLGISWHNDSTCLMTKIQALLTCVFTSSLFYVSVLLCRLISSNILG